jgi:hypothetical protein
VAWRLTLKRLAILRAAAYTEPSRSTHTRQTDAHASAGVPTTKRTVRSRALAIRLRPKRPLGGQVSHHRSNAAIAARAVDDHSSYEALALSLS